MPRPSSCHYLLLPLAMLLMLLVYAWECSRTREMRDSVGPVVTDPLVEAVKEHKRQAITNPWQGYQPQMPGGLK